ncbi:transcription regulator NOT2/NOT3/NOT5 family protein [Klebsormidium nitens]|uniref:Transcription regulator NOT2/NOT3/NOT5 family protein n=1 Tax=Klebsormidium nitens TaxID=105231 RepID=A0A1Y1HP35_KLENI|nr:transcription regulator NOT2/NOT3/NOT5 family protein [Klebsormidium nitens]|eukprot:GAQ78366.1 transcription regulator NOT2/NOT3/NOT5 family protein [Klebsormidium nitens]
MGASRKLQAEIDRVLKKVQEGIEIFDNIWEKLYNGAYDPENVNQKEKFEADLKKEIKKLQRYRDQIKTWAQSSEVKDKKPLQDARKAVEREMERFKICERETKTKAFSQEGLGKQPRTDPKEKAKAETRDWINTAVTNLETQVDTFESELENLTTKKGKQKPPRMSHLEESIERNKAHVIKLEQILRLLDNEELSPEEVNDVKDLVEDYLERNQDDFDEFSDVDDMYEALGLEKLEMADNMDAIPAVAPAVLLKEKGVKPPLPPPPAAQQAAAERAAAERAAAAAAATTTKDRPGGPLSPQPISVTPPEEPEEKAPETPKAGTPRNVIGPGVGRGAPLGRAGSGPLVPPVSPVQTTLPSPKELDTLANLAGRRVGPGIVTPPIAVPTSPNRLADLGPPSNGLARSLSGQGSGGLGGLGLKNALAGQGLEVPPLGAQSPVGSRLGAFTQAPSGNKIADAAEAVTGAGLKGPIFNPGEGSQWRPQTAGFQGQTELFQRGPRAEIQPDQKSQYLSRYQAVQQGAAVGGGLAALSGAQQAASQHPLGTPPLTPPPATPPSPSQSPLVGSRGNTRPQTPATPRSEAHSSDRAAEHLSQEDALPADFARQLSISEDDLKNADTFDVSVSIPGTLAELSSLAKQAETPAGKDQPGQAEGRPFAGAHTDPALNLQLLEASLRNIPQQKDSERPKHYVPKNPASTPASYPSVPSPILDRPELFERFETDVLFFSFYYQQGTYQQYLAAKELKKQSWRYHKKYNTWFQRHEEPKLTTDEYEQGTYVYFDFHIVHDDYQTGWCQRIKTEFTFEYQYLEDELVA